MTEQEIFQAAVEMADPVARQAYLDQACAGNPGMRHQVETLLKVHATAGDFLATPAIQQFSGKESAIDLADASAAFGVAESEKTQGFKPVPEAGHDEVSLEFLSPSTKVGSLGRLGHYEVEEVLGHGAFGIVVKAFDEVLHRTVAIKIMSPKLAATSPPRKRFLREARAAAAIRHESVVAVYAVEEQPIPYLVMEYIPGLTLHRVMEEHGPFDVADVLRVGQQIASGLGAAHSQGLIHRDIKPANILLENGLSGRVKITDFGLARAADDASLTQSGTITGTPLYMSPEQASNGMIDQRSDLFSLGSVMYAMISGRPPFRAATILAVLRRVAEDTPRPIPDIIADVPGWLCVIIAKLQAKRPEDRYSSAEEVANLLGRCLADFQANRNVSLPDDLVSASSEVATTTAPKSVVILPEETQPNGRKSVGHRRWPAVAALLLVILASFGFTEATGVTKLTATVIRLTTGSGTLVIETSDPDVEVTIDGEEVRIQGAGVKELLMKPGQHQIAALKNGEPVSQQLVTITRGGRVVVRVTMEEAITLGGKKSAPSPVSGDDPDRRAAEWVLSMGGRLMIRVSEREGEISSARELPIQFFQLIHVQLDHNEKVKDAGLSRLKGLTNLTHLRLDGSPVTDADLSPLAGLKNLVSLNLQGTGVSDDAIQHLKDLTRMEHLSIHDNPQLGDRGLKHLARMTELRYLDLRNTLVGDSGLEYLKHLPSLQTIVLLGTRVSDRGLESLAAFPRLDSLQLQNTKVTDAGLIYLSKSPTLSSLLLNSTKVTAIGVKNLVAAIPKCRIEWDGGVIAPASPALLPPHATPGTFSPSQQVAIQLEPQFRPNADPQTPLSKFALAQRPAKLEGVKSWTIETIGARGMIVALAWSPKGDYVASVCRDGGIRLIDPKDGTTKRILIGGTTPYQNGAAGHDGGQALAISPTGEFIALASDDGKVRIWNSQTGQLVRTLEQPAGARSISWSQDGTMLAGAGGPMVWTWDVKTSKTLFSKTLEKRDWLACAWSPRGDWIALGVGGNLLDFVNIKTGEFAKPIILDTCPKFLAWSPDGSKLAVRCGKPSCVLDFATKAFVGTAQGVGIAEGPFQWTKDSKFLYSLAQGNGFSDLTRCDAATGAVKRLYDFSAHGTYTQAFSLSPDGKTIATSGQDAKVNFWESESGNLFQAVDGVYGGHYNEAYSFSRNGEVLTSTGGIGSQIRIWNTDKPARPIDLDAAFHSTIYYSSATISPDGKQVALVGGHHANRFSVQILEVATGKRLFGEVVATINDAPSHLLRCAWSPDGQKLAVGSEREMLIWRAKENRFAQTLKPSKAKGLISDISWSPSGKFVSGVDLGDPGKTHFFNFETGEYLKELTLPGGPPVWRDDDLLAVGNGREVQAWSVRTGEVAFTQDIGNVKTAFPVGWIPEGGLAVQADPNQIAVFNKNRRRVRGINISDWVTVAPNLSLAAMSGPATTYLYNLVTGQPVAAMMAFPNNRWLVVSAEGHYVGSERIEDLITYVVQTAEGQQMLTPSEFAAKCHWKNDPSKVKFR